MEELLIPQPEKVHRIGEHEQPAAAASSGGPLVTPKQLDGRSPPPH
ncbi:hypothetical protein [Spongiactinospora rosea]|nr:hypothetical protein [Spongiactinospora rosea]